jgi:hypothetical protein
MGWLVVRLLTFVTLLIALAGCGGAGASNYDREATAACLRSSPQVEKARDASNFIFATLKDGHLTSLTFFKSSDEAEDRQAAGAKAGVGAERRRNVLVSPADIQDQDMHALEDCLRSA